MRNSCTAQILWQDTMFVPILKPIVFCDTGCCHANWFVAKLSAHTCCTMTALLLVGFLADFAGLLLLDFLAGCADLHTA